ncbi:hypothetical protein ACO0LF_13165 [Undibacterium sp. Di27W]|uniref:hypothetical protein n=1 Tax=Undibacterium sp. Di27W TaxID=3413036 RepID=UPI003BEFFFE6
MSTKQDKAANLADGEVEVRAWIELRAESIVNIRKITTVVVQSKTVPEVDGEGEEDMASGSYELSLFKVD